MLSLKCFSRLEWEYKHTHQPSRPEDHTSREHGAGHRLGMKRGSFSQASRELPISKLQEGPYGPMKVILMATR